MKIEIDHLVVASPSLSAGCDQLESFFGVRPMEGGCHPGLGTRNALLALEDQRYIEVLAPDPEQSPDLPAPRFLKALERPRLTWWAARCDDIAGLGAALRSEGLPVLSEGQYSRVLPDGGELRWNLLFADHPELRAFLPFFIQWHNMALHPSIGAPVCGRLSKLVIDHPASNHWPRLEVPGLDKESSGYGQLKVLFECRGGEREILVERGPAPSLAAVLAG